MVEPLILAHLIRDDEYTRIVLPFLQKDYFTTLPAQHIYTAIHEFVIKYKTSPTVDAVRLSLEQSTLTGSGLEETTTLLNEVVKISRVDANRRQWLIDQTEAFVKQRALYLAMSESLSRIDKDFESAASVPKLLTDALGVGFKTNIGHDYFGDLSARYDMYHRNEARLAFDLDMLNKITKGGLMAKTLNVVIAGTAVGKSLFLCHTAAAAIAAGKRVLYITLEMAEERIAQRIDANLLDITTDDVEELSRDAYMAAFANIRKRNMFGDLVIKEFPTSTAHAGHFRILLDELKMKKNFHPDLLIVDYLNICSSTRFRTGSQVNSYNLVKAIAEEVRGLAVEYNLPCLTATQFNRQGFDSSDPELTDTGESFGLPQTADLQIALISSEEMEADGILMVKQLKNRYANAAVPRRFTIRCDRSKMRLSDDPQQRYLSNSTRTDDSQNVVSAYTPRLIPKPPQPPITF